MLRDLNRGRWRRHPGCGSTTTAVCGCPLSGLRLPRTSRPTSQPNFPGASMPCPACHVPPAFFHRCRGRDVPQVAAAIRAGVVSRPMMTRTESIDTPRKLFRERAAHHGFPAPWPCFRHPVVQNGRGCRCRRAATVAPFLRRYSRLRPHAVNAAPLGCAHLDEARKAQCRGKMPLLPELSLFRRGVSPALRFIIEFEYAAIASWFDSAFDLNPPTFLARGAPSSAMRMRLRFPQRVPSRASWRSGDSSFPPPSTHARWRSGGRPRGTAHRRFWFFMEHPRGPRAANSCRRLYGPPPVRVTNPWFAFRWPEVPLRRPNRGRIGPVKGVVDLPGPLCPSVLAPPIFGLDISVVRRA